jgi:tetratricopeptide (TPR) repeat protein
MAAALASLGNLAYDQGDLSAARAFHEKSLRIRQELGDRYGTASSLLNLGGIARAEGDLVAARALCENGRAIFQELGDGAGIGAALASQAKLAHDEGDTDAARGLYLESLALFQELKSRLEIAEVLEGLAAVDTSDAQPERAARLFGAAEALREAIGTPVPPADRGELERQVADARAALGDDRFAAAWAAGRVLTPEQAVALAFEQAEGGVCNCLGSLSTGS